jgi:hypothetical protein
MVILQQHALLLVHVLLLGGDPGVADDRHSAPSFRYCKKNLLDAVILTLYCKRSRSFFSRYQDENNGPFSCNTKGKRGGLLVICMIPWARSGSVLWDEATLTSEFHIAVTSDACWVGYRRQNAGLHADALGCNSYLTHLMSHPSFSNGLWTVDRERRPNDSGK